MDYGNCMKWWRGLGIPTIVSAYRMEEWSKGGVPITSWLGTELARLELERTRTNWARWRAQRNAEHARNDTKRRHAKALKPAESNDGPEAGSNPNN